MGKKNILRTGKGQGNDEKWGIQNPRCGAMGRISGIPCVGMTDYITSRVGIADRLKSAKHEHFVTWDRLIRINDAVILKRFVKIPL